MDVERAPSALEKLGLKRNEQAKAPIYDPGLYSASLPSGWCVIFADGSENMNRLTEGDAANLSATGDVLFFYCDDTPMWTRMALYSGETLVWALEHNGSTEGFTMRTTGTVPERGLALLKEAELAQSAEDPEQWPVDHIYDVTAAFGLEYIGFRHDRTLGEDDFPQTWELGPAKIAESAQPQPRWRFW